MEQIETIYDPLDPTKSPIRLLKIISDDGDMVACRLSTASLDDNLPFCTLSYVLGNISIRFEIILDGYVIGLSRIQSQRFAMFPQTPDCCQS
jgi:hypothetical protein